MWTRKGLFNTCNKPSQIIPKLMKFFKKLLYSGLMYVIIHFITKFDVFWSMNPLLWSPPQIMVRNTSINQKRFPCSTFLPQTTSLCHCSIGLIVCALFFKDFIYLFERETDQQKALVSGEEGEAERILSRLPAEHRSRYRAWSYDPEIMTWAETKS